MLKEPVLRTATRPTYVPICLPLVTTARTTSPVWKPLTTLACLGPVRGKPCSSMRHICLHPCPQARMSKGRVPQVSRCSGVDAPTHAASLQWDLGKLRCVRLYLVRPPVPHSTGKHKACKRSYKAHRVALTADASLRGALACT